MLATQTPETAPEARDVKQIKERLAQSLKALQRRYVTSDAVVTSEDGDANLLCCALEAIFIHGIKSKHVRQEAAGRSRKVALPQPFFWSLLKTVTHRDVITELEKLSFVGTDVGRCRAWLRLALNHGLLECYLASLFRDDAALHAHYRPSALLLDPEEREVLLSYLQGLASLTFNLSYKSAVLNEWTTTPLALAGLCPFSHADLPDPPPPVDGGSQPVAKPPCKELWDSVSQSSGSSSEAPVLQARGSAPLHGGGGTGLHSSSLSLDTSGSSQLSSSLSSDSLLQGQDARGPAGEPWSTCDQDTPICVNTGSRRLQKNSLTDHQESGHCSQDSMPEDSLVSSAGPDPFSETALFSSSDSEIQASSAPSDDPDDLLPEPEPELEPELEPEPEPEPEPEQELEPAAGVESVEDQEEDQEEQEEEEEQPSPVVAPAEETGAQEASRSEGPRRSASILSRKESSESLPHSRSWISEDDIYKPNLEEVPDSEGASPADDFQASPTPPCVVHRRQIGLSNPFRGLLKLGHLERRGAVGLWRDYYCELSPFEFRLYADAEERDCCDNCSLLRCEDACVTLPEGRFELAFSGKRLYLRAANRDEAEDWVDRIVEAVNKCRPASGGGGGDEHWEVLQPAAENGSASSVASSPERHLSSSDAGAGQEAPPPPQELDWTRTADLETDAIKEAVLYCSVDREARSWTPMVFSLSLEALKGFKVHEGKKSLRLSHPIGDVRDVVPDVSAGGPAFFRLLTVRETLRLRAQSPEEARSWRELVRGALDSYLESGEDAGPEEPTMLTGNLRRLVQHRLKEDGALLAHLCTVPSEKGLDTQGFKCAGCPRQIGPSRGRARLCEFSGRYYCDVCHSGETSVIPSRMVHNWDLMPRQVSTKAVRLLAQVEQEPLLDLEQLNPDLGMHSESMAQAQKLRQKLRLLGDYLLTCRSGACKTLQARMGQRTYLLQSSQLYSVLDLRQIAEGRYAHFLLALLHYASSHVFQCDLCTQRGFFCQICQSNEIIFPFQLETTTRCQDCKAVFHLACKAAGSACPRCERMKKYLERDLQD
ncbi:unnamed protein product [Ophioblennius macclurei]